jgi:hypothetical protein
MKSGTEPNPELGKQAADYARQQTLKSLKRYKVSTGRVSKRLSEALDATEVKVFHDKGGEIIYSKPLIAHGPRLKAIEIASALLEMKPAEKHDVNVQGTLKVSAEDKFAELLTAMKAKYGVV